MNILHLIDQTPLHKRRPADYNHPVDIRLLSLVYDMLCQMLRLSFIRLGTYRDEEQDRRRVQPQLEALRRRAGRALERAEIHNFKVRLKAAMLGHAQWRAQVTHAHGGEAALDRWETLHTRYEKRKALPVLQARYSRARLLKLRRGQVRLPVLPPVMATNIDMCFRLAPLPRLMPRRPDFTQKQLRERAEARRLGQTLRQELRDALGPKERYARTRISTKEVYRPGHAPKDTLFCIHRIHVKPIELRSPPRATALGLPKMRDNPPLNIKQFCGPADYAKPQMQVRVYEPD